MTTHNYKLRVNQVLEIKEQLANTKTSMNKIALAFGLSLDTVRKINQGEAHEDVGSFSYPIRTKKYLHIHDCEKPASPKKLTDDQAFEVMIRLEMGESPYALAKEYGVSHILIMGISKRPMFRHISMYDEEF